ncbi:MAG TPA: hypothetical protein PLT06_11145 [Syntrophorhabdaceae bacterium]|nr:hypothetical protein [Syntrophorhabdaceae bacterium]
MPTHSPNPSLTAQLKDEDALLSSSPSGQVIQELLKEVRELRREIAQIKAYFHIDQPIPKVIDLKRHAEEKARRFLENNKEGKR